MRVELLRAVKHDGRTYAQGDAITVERELGEYFCASGWAKDLANTISTAEPSVAPVELKVQSAKHINKAKELR
jgi:hypothetical protein